LQTPALTTWPRRQEPFGSLWSKLGAEEGI
jgi:hypothetical protein